jgi:hypothetical protein
MSKYKGVVIFKIFPNDCLNGVYSNDDPATKNEIFNEIARTTPKSKDEYNQSKDGKKDSVLGVYTCSYMDLLSEPHTCELKIEVGKNAQYDFTWYESGTPTEIRFTGIGWRTHKNQITMAYGN